MLRHKPDAWTGSRASSLVSLETEYTREDIRITVTGLPSCGLIVKAGAIVPVALGDTVTAAELGALAFVPSPLDSGAARPMSCSLIYVPQNCERLPLSLVTDEPVGIAADATVTITELPTNGSLFLADGVAPLHGGQTISSAQLCSLTFRPADRAVGQISLLRYRSADQALAGDVLLVVGPDMVSRAINEADADERDDNGSISPLAAALLLEAGLSSLNAAPASAAVDPGEILTSDSSGGSNAKIGALPEVFGNKIALITDKVVPDRVFAPEHTILAQSPTTTGTTGTATSLPTEQPRHHRVGSSTPPGSGDLKMAPLSVTLTAPIIPSITSTPTTASTPTTVPPPSGAMALPNEALIAPASITSGTSYWTNSNGGYWNSAANWNGGIPGLGSNVVIDAVGLATSTANVDIGSLVVVPGGTLVSDSGTLFTVDGNVVNNGVVEAGAFGGGQNSAVDIKGNISGTGSFEISNQAVLEIQGSVAGQVTNGSFSGITVAFATGNGELILDNSAQFHGLIASSSPSSSLSPTDLIDLKDLAFTSSMSTSINYDMTSNISTVNFSNGSKTVTLQFSGKDPVWNLSSDGQGGTIISDPPATNAIVLENELPGTPMSVWQIAPGQDSTKLQGYTTSISTNVGGTVDFKIDNLTGSGNYEIQIYRLGYYGGDGARLVDTINHQSATAVVQPNPIVNSATGEVDAGNWSVTDAWNVPTSAVSGVYIANILQGNPDNPTQIFQVPFIVKDSSSTSNIVFQTDDETWEAYNGWGGANLYGGNGPGLSSDGGTGVGAAFAVSYNRPLTTYDSSGFASGPQDTVWGAEYSAIYWLEENGYDVSYISGMDAATDGSLLLNHKIYMDVGHDEYWTDSQVANVQAAANAGVNLAFMSGNEIFWQTQFTPSIDGTQTANRTLVTYKDSHYEQIINPTGQGTGSFEAPTSWGGAGMPSNALTGTLFQVDQTELEQITIPYGETQLRFWRNTSVANTAPGQTATLTATQLGYEWDSAPDNGFEPVGLVDLSSTTVSEPTAFNTEFGNVDTSGTATHNLVEYRDPTSGALVFGAGTVYWSWGLSDQADGVGGEPSVDPSTQQSVVNLFADMGVQPDTLEASLKIATASTDHTPPKSTITSVSTTNPLEGQLVTVTGTATDSGGGVIAGVDVSTDGGKTWHPATSAVGAVTETWSYSFNAPAPGTYTIESRAVDDSINVETPGPGKSYTSLPSSALSIFSSTDTPATADVTDANGVEVGLKFTSSTNGEITGIRFYKGALNTGPHIVDLWSSTGTLLATATATNETASGWQQVNFLNPVKITAGATYIASYHMTNGEYSDTPYYFDTLQNPTNGSLSTPASGLGGVFAYGTGSVFPNNMGDSADNYWVDVVFNDTSEGPQANDESGFVTSENTSLLIPASTLLANDTDPNGLPLSISGVSNATNGTVSYNATTKTVTFTPNSGYTGPGSFTYTITDGQFSASGTVALQVNYPVTAQSLFNTNDAPALEANDPNSVEVGVKFQASTNGTITGIRFYKSALDTGTHVADLWSSTGTLLATATFTNETASGWQEVNLSKPVVVAAGTTYIVSYHTNGNYSFTSNYFANSYTNGELTASANAGVFSYGTGSIFPATSVTSNYYVDVVFDGASLQPPVANNDSGFDVTANAPLAISASALLANDTDPYGLPLSIASVSNATNGTVAYNATTQTVTFTPNAGYQGPASFTYTITDGADTASASVALAVTPPPPVANNDSGLVTTESTALQISASTLLANDTDPNGLPLSISGVSNATNGTVSYNATTQTVTFTPNSGYTGPANFTYTITDGQATASGNVSLAVNYPVTAQSLFNTNDAPALEANDPNSVEVGVKFQASANGTITGIRFYKSALDTGTHVADLWSSTGTLLATATFTNETASGWQEVNLSNPVVVTAGTTYVVSYHTNGNYSYTANYFATSHTNGELTASANAGVFAYGAGAIFPTNSFNATNYYVDVVFDGASLQPPVANNDSGFDVTKNTPLAISASALLANDTDPYGLPLSIASVSNATNGTVAYNAATQTVTFTPNAGYQGPASFTYTVTDGTDTASASVALAVTPPPPVANNDSGLVATENTALLISASTLLANDTDPNGLPLSIAGVSNASNGTVSYDPNTQTVTFTPTSGYTGPAGFTYTVTDGQGTASANVSLAVNFPAASQSLFNSSDTPATVTVNDANSIELGVKFQASASGSITGVRFYKGPQNIGTHVADLWSATGTLLATATFTNETASGWQQVNFATPVGVVAGATYVVSYHTSGDYSASANFFATADTNGDLTAPSSATSGGNGVYAYGTGSVFPTNSFNATNYWVDVVFDPATVAPPVANADSLTGTENSTLSIPASTLLANDTDAFGLPLSITGVSNATNGTVSYDQNTQTVSFVPTAGFAGAAGFTYTITDGQGNSASANVAVAINAAANPTANSVIDLVATENTTLSISAASLLANDTDPGGFALSITGVSNATNGTVSYDANTQTVNFVPTAGYTGTASFSFSVGDGHGGTASAGASLLVNDPTTASLFNPAIAPSIAAANDPNAIEVGVKFTSTENGDITGLRFFKGPGNTGTHVADLWSSSGTLLATATFTNETASGWQQVNFSTPVPITAGTTYVASYHTNSGDYAADPNLFATSVPNGPLTAPSSASSGGNGVYAYGSSSLFPTNSFNSTSYGVDVVFKPQLAA